MKRHRWELLQNHGRTWKCENDGCQVTKREVTTADGSRVTHTDYTWPDGASRKAPPCPTGWVIE